ncbi:MAG: hypothetical protein M1822_000709 [Bathelium mastoideum]|nr:MAG: hypothetical protein M1822_000709 [Bathelium mastoideum]
MTAVAPPLTFQPTSRTGWNAGSAGQSGLASMSAEDVSRMFMPRKSAQRTNSSSSLASSASSASTVSASTAQTNGVSPTNGIDPAGWGARKKPTRGIWPSGKSEPISGITAARPQSVAAATSGPSAASAISALHSPSSLLPSQHMGSQSQPQQNGASRPQGRPENPAVLHLLPMNGTFERKSITVPYYPDVLRIGRQTNNRTIPTPHNGYFDSKVLSRQHAEVWADSAGKIWIRDVKSSNGTFVNGQRLSQENKDSDPHELREQDLLELGIDIVSEDQKTIVHHKVAARVEHAGIYPTGNNVLDLNFGDLDPANGGGMMAQPLGHNMSLRGRNGSQSSLNSNGRVNSAPPSVVGTNMNVMGQPRNMAWLLGQISIDHVVRRLNSELKQAKQQSQDLQRTGQYVEAVLHSEPKKEEPKVPPPIMKASPIKTDLKTHFSEPPAPPPQQPLPEKPDTAPALPDSIVQPILKRSNTERPRTPSVSNSPTRNDTSLQIFNLVEALTTAKKEIDSQSVRLKDLEEMLAQEKLARESAEERAQRLEIESRKDSADVSEPASELIDGTEDATNSEIEISGTPAETAAVESSTNRLQERIDLMVAEMNELKMQMDNYKQRAESAEAESAKDRQTLAEMVEKIRKEDANRVTQTSESLANGSAKSHKKSDSGSSSGDSVPKYANGALTITRPPASKIWRGDEILRNAGVENGKPISAEQLAALENAMAIALREGKLETRARGRSDHLTQSAPYISMVSVVLLGVGMVAYLNSWQKGER